MHISASATAKVSPYDLVADLTALATAPYAVLAQRKVNRLMATAAKDAKGASGLEASFQDYSVQFIDDRPAHWIAQQTLELRGANAETLLDLVGHLQTLGLAIGSLDWQVSRERNAETLRQATIVALKTLRAEAAEAAAALGLVVDHIDSVDIGEGPPVFPMERPAFAMATTMPAPQSTPRSQEVTATVSADVVLRAPGAGNQKEQP
jgi:predicted secreted protein